jgi:tRNA pseudouridine55 synthase
LPDYPVLTRSLFTENPAGYAERLLDENGAFVLVDKIYGETSFQAVNAVRFHLCRALGVKRLKVGHAGTLDPLATGLLVLGVGKATKQLDSILGRDKTYVLTLRLGVSSPSHDLETPITPVSYRWPSEERLLATLNEFTGSLEQFPPVHSAIKQQGKPIYLKARRGEAVEVVARNVEIRSLELVSFADPFITLRCVCSKGTYIRSLVRDLARRLDTEGVLTDLRREGIGDWDVAEAMGVDSIKQLLMK